jgi:hypothetical protein
MSQVTEVEVKLWRMVDVDFGGSAQGTRAGVLLNIISFKRRGGGVWFKVGI